MKLLDKIILNTVFAIQILLAFMLLFESKVSLPIWMIPLGRMHPLVLHFPIGLLVLVGMMQFFRNEFEPKAFGKIQRFTLLIAAVTTSFAALMGFFLSQEEGYSGNLVVLHKWTGVAVSFLAYGLLMLDQAKKPKLRIFQGVLAVSLLTLVVAGHFGAELTHGENYVLGPLMPKEDKINPETPVYEAAIVPLLKQKCYSCHNDRKHKGDLNMASLEKILKGGENGPIWVANDADNSPMIQRALLPLEEDEHMPPEGKPQLTDAEIKLLHTWISAGADVKQPIQALREGSPLFATVMPLLNQAEKKGPAYSFPSAAIKTVERLNTPYVSVFPETSSSPALHAKFFVRQGYDPARLKALADVKAQLVSINLTNMPITDADLSTLGQFAQLEKLTLNGTDITGNTLNELQSCTKLKDLAISNTAVGPNILGALKQLPSLESVFVWNTQIAEADIENMQSELPKVNFHIGYIPDSTEVLKLTAPQLLNESQVIAQGEKIKLKHTFPGSIIRYTLDGSEPDSLESPIYEGPIAIDSYTQLSAKTFQKDWISSDATTYTFFKKGATPDSAELIQPPARDYKGSGARTLIDNEKGLANSFRSVKWLGYKEKPFEAYLYFEPDNVPEVSQLTLSYCINMGNYIMPPASVEVWAGANKNSLKRLYKKNFTLPKGETSDRVTGLNLDIPKGSYACYKVVARPIRVLPSWHRGAGDKAWVFVDEVFLN